MNFDPFGDFESRGYLRNYAGEKDPRIVKDLEHRAFKANIRKALYQLATIAFLSYADVLSTHKILFEAIYPWAGQGRDQTAPNIAVRRGNVLFAHPIDAGKAVKYALKLGQDVDFMASKPGEVMSYLAHAHPVLDGNGRTILTVHTELAERAGISIDWSATNKTDYLSALGNNLLHPNSGTLDSYLAPFLRPAVGRASLAEHVVSTQGLAGGDYFPEVEYAQYSNMEVAEYVTQKYEPPKPS